MHILAAVQKYTSLASKALLALALIAVVFSPLQGLVPQAQAQEFVNPSNNTMTTPYGEVVNATTGAVVTPVSPQMAQAQQQTAQEAEARRNSGSITTAAECGWTTNWSLCLSNVVYMFTVGLMSIFAYVGSYVFNISIQLTLNSVTYSQQFVTEGWTMVRDLANMAFIFMLVYIALVVIFRADTSNTMRSLAAVVVVALLINFSFFISRVTIDAGNILAVQFYNAVQAPPMINTANSSGAPNVTRLLAGNSQTKDLTYNMMQLIGVQSLLGPGSFSANFSQNNGFFVNLVVFSFVYIAIGVILAILAFTFFVVGFKFLIRIVILWLVIIASPLAFVAGALSNVNSKGAGGAKKLFEQWRSALVEYSFYPAVFLFMFWIVNSFAVTLGGTNGSILNNAFGDVQGATAANTGSFLVPLAAAVSSISVRLGLLVILLFAAMKASDKIAATGSSGARMATGWAGRALSGSVAWGGRNTAGWAGSSFAQSKLGRRMGNNVITRPLVYGARRIGRGTYDVRGVKGLQSAVKGVTGVDMGKASDRTYLKDFEARVKKREDFAKTLKPTQRQLDVAYRKAVKDVKDPDDKAELQSAAADYATKMAGRADGTYSNAQVRDAAERLKNITKKTGIADKAKIIAGDGFAKKFGESLGKRSWRNLYGVTSSGIPFHVSSSDKEAAARMRDTKNEGERIRNIMGVPKNPVPPPTSGTGTGGGTAAGGGGAGGTTATAGGGATAGGRAGGGGTGTGGGTTPGGGGRARGAAAAGGSTGTSGTAPAAGGGTAAAGGGGATVAPRTSRSGGEVDLDASSERMLRAMEKRLDELNLPEPAAPAQPISVGRSDRVEELHAKLSDRMLKLDRDFREKSQATPLGVGQDTANILRKIREGQKTQTKVLGTIRDALGAGTHTPGVVSHSEASIGSRGDAEHAGTLPIHKDTPTAHIANASAFTTPTQTPAARSVAEAPVYTPQNTAPAPTPRAIPQVPRTPAPEIRTPSASIPNPQAPGAPQGTRRKLPERDRIIPPPPPRPQTPPTQDTGTSSSTV